MLSLWFIQQHFNEDTTFELRKNKRKEEASEKGERKKTRQKERQTREGSGDYPAPKDRRRWTRGREG